jgi:hypothetical protein
LDFIHSSFIIINDSSTVFYDNFFHLQEVGVVVKTLCVDVEGLALESIEFDCHFISKVLLSLVSHAIALGNFGFIFIFWQSFFLNKTLFKPVYAHNMNT